MLAVDVGVLYGLAFIVSLLASLTLTPLAARLARRLGVIDRPGPTKFHRQPTPYLGGVAVAASLFLVAGITTGASGQFLTVLFGGLALVVVGLLDDKGAATVPLKLGVEVTAAIALWAVGIRAGLFGVEALDLLLTVFWVVGITNAVNMLDNMDGLAAGVVAISSLTFFGIAAARGSYLVAALALSVAGASLGFLRHNYPPARIFLGDAGTLPLGFLVAALGLKLDLIGEAGLVRTAIPVLALAVPIFDAAVVILARLRDGRRFYVGGTDHTSHRLAAMGLSPGTIALGAYAIQIGCSVAAFWLLYASDGAALGLVSAVGAASVATLVAVLALPVMSAGSTERIASDDDALGAERRPR